MKKIISVILFSFLAGSCYSQDTRQLFDKGSLFFSKNEYDSAFAVFKKIYTQGRGDETLIAKSHYNMAKALFEKNQYDKAKLIFDEILEADYNEMDEGGRGGGLLTEPYALYKNNSCKHLAEIALEQGKYEEALVYTELFDKKFPYEHFCRYERYSNSVFVAYTYGRCYEGLGWIDEAISVMLPRCQESALAGNDELVELLCLLITAQYSKKEIMSELEKAVSGISVKTKRDDVRKYDYHYTRIFGTEIPLWGYTPEERYDPKKIYEMEGNELYTYCFINGNFYQTLLKYCQEDCQEDASFSLMR